MKGKEMSIDNYGLGNLNLKYDYNTMAYPTTVYLKVTDSCNCNCNFCSQKRSSNYMTNECFNRILKELGSISTSNIVYTGGEPLLHREIEIMVQKAAQFNYNQILVTNGILITKRESIIPHFKTIGISLHGTEEIHDAIMHYEGAYGNVLRALEILKKYDVGVVINYTVNEWNNSYGQLEHVAKICRDTGAMLNVAKLNYIGKGKNVRLTELNKMLEYVHMLKKEGYNVVISNCVAPCLVEEEYRYMTHGCSAGQTIAAVEANGDVKICPSSSIILGNVISDSLKKIWNCKEIGKFKQGKWIPVRCRTCSDFIKCKAGCKAEGDGEFWNHICDHQVLLNWENLWKQIRKRKIILTFERISKSGKYYYLHTRPIIKCSKKYYEIIKSIDGTLTGEEFVNSQIYLEKKNKLIELLVALYVDRIIETCEEDENEAF